MSLRGKRNFEGATIHKEKYPHCVILEGEEFVYVNHFYIRKSSFERYGNKPTLYHYLDNKSTYPMVVKKYQSEADVMIEEDMNEEEKKKEKNNVSYYLKIPPDELIVPENSRRNN